MHLVVGMQPAFRVNGRLIPQEGEVLTSEDTSGMAQAILTSEEWQQLQEKRDVDLSYGIENLCRYRVNVFYQRDALSLAFRVISGEIPHIEDLGIPLNLKEIVEKPHGLFLVTGPTGCGKSTSLAAMIGHLNQTQSRHIITLEDPIEYLHQHGKSIIEQREIGSDARSFQEGLRACLRQDPDVILLGELRDLETIKTALIASETGHLVLGTLHTQDSTGTVDRIIDVFPVHQRNQMRTVLANVLLGVMSQRLLPTRDLSRRVVATEMMINNSAIKNLIRSDKMHQIPNVLQTSKQLGMHTMKMSIMDLVSAGVVSADELIPYETNNLSDIL